MTIILKRQDQTSICCYEATRTKPSGSMVKRVELMVGMSLIVVCIWVLVTFF